jgi:myo-inositol-1(or 4)-monophosphatase
MKLLNLAARVCNAFSMNDFHHLRTVQKVKEDQCRDVVTELDMKLHKITEEYVNERLPGCNLLSEESAYSDDRVRKWNKDEWLIVDPLDGSNNYALGLPNYGFMAAHLHNGRIEGSVIVLPEHDQYMVLEGDKSIYAQAIPFRELSDNRTVYYAYPPKQNIAAREARNALLDLIDMKSAGVYRYGSACAGLYQLICGRHMAFIGHGIRLWDAIAFFPMLASRQIKIVYAIKGNELTLLASSQVDFLESAAHILETQQGFYFQSFLNDGFLVEVDAA